MSFNDDFINWKVKKWFDFRAKAGDGKIKVVDINKKESLVEVTEIVTLSSVIELTKAAFPGLTHQVYLPPTF